MGHPDPDPPNRPKFRLDNAIKMLIFPDHHTKPIENAMKNEEIIFKVKKISKDPDPVKMEPDLMCVL